MRAALPVPRFCVVFSNAVSASHPANTGRHSGALDCIDSANQLAEIVGFLSKFTLTRMVGALLGHTLTIDNRYCR